MNIPDLFLKFYPKKVWTIFKVIQIKNPLLSMCLLYQLSNIGNNGQENNSKVRGCFALYCYLFLVLMIMLPEQYHQQLERNKYRHLAI